MGHSPIRVPIRDCCVKRPHLFHTVQWVLQCRLSTAVRLHCVAGSPTARRRSLHAHFHMLYAPILTKLDHSSTLQQESCSVSSLIHSGLARNLSDRCRPTP